MIKNFNIQSKRLFIYYFIFFINIYIFFNYSIKKPIKKETIKNFIPYEKNSIKNNPQKNSFVIIKNI